MIPIHNPKRWRFYKSIWQCFPRWFAQEIGKLEVWSSSWATHDLILTSTMEKDSCTWIPTQLVGIAKDNGNAKVPSLQTSPIVWRRGGFSASAHREASESQQGQRYQLAGGDAALAPDLSFLSVETVRVAIDAWNWLWVGTSEQVSTVSVYQVSLNQRLIKTDRSWWEVDGKLSSGGIGWDPGLV